MVYNWDRNERDEGFDELGAAVIFFTLVSLIVSAAYLVTSFAS